MKKALIIKKEYLDKILSGEKTMELRSRITNIRGKIGLIESGSGLIVGECVITDSIEMTTRSSFEREKVRHGCHIGFFDKYKHGWCIESGSANRYDSPIPYDHPQGAIIWVNIEDKNGLL